jgi:hypothetical protein
MYHIKKFNNKNNKNNNNLNESVINSSSFLKIKVKTRCKSFLFDKFPNDAFIVVLNKTGQVIIYEKKHKIAFNNLREVISLFGSKFLHYPLSETGIGNDLFDYYFDKTGLEIREIYKYNLFDDNNDNNNVSNNVSNDDIIINNNEKIQK